MKISDNVREKAAVRCRALFHRWSGRKFATEDQLLSCKDARVLAHHAYWAAMAARRALGQSADQSDVDQFIADTYLDAETLIRAGWSPVDTSRDTEVSP